MSKRRKRIPTAVTLTIGIILGWAISSHRPAVVQAVIGDRSGDDALAAGPVAIQYNEGTKTQATQDALYFLDYRGARLLGTVPVQKQSVKGAQLIDGFAERDLIADFKVDTDRGPSPHFLMTPGSLGAYGEGWSPLYVFETTTKQVAVYRLQPQGFGAKAKFDLVERTSFAELPALPTAP